MLPVYKIWHTLLSTRILLSKLLLSFLKKDLCESKCIEFELIKLQYEDSTSCFFTFI